MISFRIDIPAFAEALLLFSLLETFFFSIRLCTREFSSAKTIKIY